MRIRRLTFIALMAALANILSLPPIALPITPEISIHFTQLPIFIAGIVAGPAAGLMTGAVGGLYMSFAKIPFIIGGLAILGWATGLFAKRVRHVYACLLAWLVQAPYVVVTDYAWFAIFLKRTPEASWAFVVSIMVVLTIEAAISSVLAEVIVRYLRGTRMLQQASGFIVA